MMNGSRSLDPSQIIAPSQREFVYFEERHDGAIKIGYTGQPKRPDKYVAGKFKLLAVIPANQNVETALIYHFAPYLAERREFFDPVEPLTDYIIELVRCGYAATSYKQAEETGRLGFNIWHPEKLSKSIETSGQHTIFSRLSVPERIAYAAKEATNHSMSDEWFTPPIWLERARKVLGEIDLDPASCKEANINVQAKTWITKDQNALDGRNRWCGRVWLNPPYGRGDFSAKSFIAKLKSEFDGGHITEAITCLNLNSMGSLWFKDVFAIARLHLIPNRRVNFIPPATRDKVVTSANKGTVFSYIGQNPNRFSNEFGKHGFMIMAAA